MSCFWIRCHLLLQVVSKLQLLFPEEVTPPISPSLCKTPARVLHLSSKCPIAKHPLRCPLPGQVEIRVRRFKARPVSFIPIHHYMEKGKARPWKPGVCRSCFLIYRLTTIISDTQWKVLWHWWNETVVWGRMRREETRSLRRNLDRALSDSNIPALVNPVVGLAHLLPWTVQTRPLHNVRYWPSALTT